MCKFLHTQGGEPIKYQKILSTVSGCFTGIETSQHQQTQVLNYLMDVDNPIHN
jgi:hypothetical protein